MGDGKGYSPIVADDIVALPYAEGKTFTSRPDDPLSCASIQSLTDAPLKLYDGRMNHNNGWFVLRSEIPAGVTKNAIRWRIPGGVISGTALIRPDFPELLTFPFLWQQTEYVLGGGSSHYMFLVLAVKQLMGE